MLSSQRASVRSTPSGVPSAPEPTKLVRFEGQDAFIVSVSALEALNGLDVGNRIDERLVRFCSTDETPMRPLSWVVAMSLLSPVRALQRSEATSRVATRRINSSLGGRQAGASFSGLRLSKFSGVSSGAKRSRSRDTRNALGRPVIRDVIRNL